MITIGWKGGGPVSVVLRSGVKIRAFYNIAILHYHLLANRIAELPKVALWVPTPSSSVKGWSIVQYFRDFEALDGFALIWNKLKVKCNLCTAGHTVT